MLKILSRLFFLSIIFFILSCATRRVEVPVYEGVDVRDFLALKNNIYTIEAVFSITYEKDDTEIRGEGMVNISRNGNLNLRIYSFGFLALELTSENGIIKSTPMIDRNKGTILTSGLRDCFFWWDIQDFGIEEQNGAYLLKNSLKKIWVDSKTMLPLKQTVSLEDGREVTIFYEGTEKIGDVWYPSKIRIELQRHAVTLRIKDISFAPVV